MKTNKYSVAPAVELNEVVVEQGIAISDPSQFDLVVDGFGEEQSWD